MNIKNLVEQLVSSSTQEHFDSNGKPIKTGGAVVSIIVAFLLVALVVLLINLLISKPLWNHCLCKLVSVKKCESVWHIIGTTILLGLLLPSNLA